MGERIKITTKKPLSIKENYVPHKLKTGFRSQSSYVDRILFLQRTIGNQAVQRLIKSGDRYEQEADRGADAVMRMPEQLVQQQPEEEDEEELIQTKPLAEQITPLVQRQVEEEEKPIEELEEEEEPLMTKRISGSTRQIRDDLHIQLNRSRSGGQPLPEADRSFMEKRFGVDFSGVRIHTDGNAVQMNRGLNAEAFTYGRDIYFGAGGYSPGTSSGKRLLAHELTHVVQQKSINVFQSGKIVERIPHISNSSDKKTKAFQFYQTPDDPMIQFQRFRDCTPGITRAAMTQDQIDNLLLGSRMAAEFLAIYAEDAVRNIRAGTASAAEVAAFAGHFGAPTPAQINTILDRFIIISRRLSSNRLFICNTAGSAYCSNGSCAYVWCGGPRNLMHICPPFFQDPFPCAEPDTDSTMIHESAHAAGACYPNVNVHFYPGGAGYPPADAHDNAPSYAGFARAVF